MPEYKVRGKDRMATRWDCPQTADWYIRDRFSHPVWQLLHRREVGVVNREISKISAACILDLATGPARVAADLTGFRQGTAVDFSPEMLKVAASRLLVLGQPWTVVRADAFALPFPSGSFNLVTTFRFLRHFAQSDRSKILTGIRRVLKPGGILIFEALNRGMDPCLFRPQFTGAADRSLYDELYLPEEITRELKRHGFALQSLVPNLCFGRLYFGLAGISARYPFPLRLGWQLLEPFGSHRCFQWEVVARKI